jgi:hypothetical protein
MLKSEIIFGSAKFTMVWSSLPKKVPTITVKRIHHFREEGSVVGRFVVDGVSGIVFMRRRLNVKYQITNQ